LERGLVNWNSGAGAGVDDFDLENVLWNLIFMFFFPETVGNFIIPTGELHHFFRGVGQPPTSD